LKNLLLGEKCCVVCSLWFWDWSHKGKPVLNGFLFQRHQLITNYLSLIWFDNTNLVWHRYGTKTKTENSEHNLELHTVLRSKQAVLRLDAFQPNSDQSTFFGRLLGSMSFTIIILLFLQFFTTARRWIAQILLFHFN